MSPPPLTRAGTLQPSGDAERLTVVRSVLGIEGGLLEVDWRAEPGWRGGPAHRHPHAEERYEILDGAARFRLDGAERLYRAGESVIVPAGVEHALTSVPGSGVRLLWQVRPTGDEKLPPETIWSTADGTDLDGGRQ
jgi:quercetin dioxygenase-like cupin family protein